MKVGICQDPIIQLYKSQIAHYKLLSKIITTRSYIKRYA